MVLASRSLKIGQRSWLMQAKHQIPQKLGYSQVCLKACESHVKLKAFIWRRRAKTWNMSRRSGWLWKMLESTTRLIRPSKSV